MRLSFSQLSSSIILSFQPQNVTFFAHILPAVDCLHATNRLNHGLPKAWALPHLEKPKMGKYTGEVGKDRVKRVDANYKGKNE